MENESDKENRTKSPVIDLMENFESGLTRDIDASEKESDANRTSSPVKIRTLESASKAKNTSTPMTKHTTAPSSSHKSASKTTPPKVADVDQVDEQAEMEDVAKKDKNNSLASRRRLFLLKNLDLLNNSNNSDFEEDDDLDFGNTSSEKEKKLRSLKTKKKTSPNAKVKPT